MKRKKLTMNIGIISFMIVFIILCLITFSVLSLVSAQSNLNMANRSLEHNQEYYQLASQGEEALHKIDDYLYQLYQQSSQEDYFQNLDDLKTIIPDLHISQHDLDLTIIGQTQKLYIQLEVLYPGDKLYKIKSWKVQSKDEWNPDEKMEIL